MPLLSDPLFYAAAIPAVILVGLAKGGFATGLAMLGVPLMSLVVSPIQAAGIMLPILCAMDAVAVVSYRGIFHRPSVAVLLPGAVVGIALGWATAAWVDESWVRLIVGLVTVFFVLDYWTGGAARPAKKQNASKGIFWGMVAGFTSFVSHAGGPPAQMYLLPQKFGPVLLSGTIVITFAVMNLVKLVPYFLLGQFDRANLFTSAALLPLAPLATYAGVRLVKLVSQELFYRITYVGVFLVAVKLIWDGIAGLLA
ncbi:sulfite exporter TauE/SafE family protein [Breoghania sp.]|uniref:sulfite exporter TauE/SafE family protein n=1 Tax=Breoghania sp. TaxID=2065378 RepID=UPI0029CA914A|nr:sulfite exporter TauE/SafE family protein [Breoghania sp.]